MIDLFRKGTVPFQLLAERKEESRLTDRPEQHDHLSLGNIAGPSLGGKVVVHFLTGLGRPDPRGRLIVCLSRKGTQRDGQGKGKNRSFHVDTIPVPCIQRKHTALAALPLPVTLGTLNDSPLTRLHHFTLATRDVIAAREFFLDTLGWKQISRPGNIDIQAAWLAIGDGQQLHLLHVEQFEISPFEAEFGRHFAFDYPLEEFPALKERLIAHGAELIDPIRETPFERFFFREPNGYIFEVVDADREPEA